MQALLALQDAAPSFIDFDPAAPRDVFGAWMICFLTLAVFSFLYKDNPFYKIAEHIFVGVGTAYYALQFYQEGILGTVYEYMVQTSEAMEAGSETFLIADFAVSPLTAMLLRGLAGVLGVMLAVRLVAPNSWAPRWPLAIMVGVYSALKLTGETQSKLVEIVKGLIKPIVPANVEQVGWLPEGVAIESTPLFLTIANLLLVIGVVCALSHFLFTWRRNKALAGLSRAGIVVLMITFGSMFGFTVLGRIALLIKRVEDLFRYSAPDYAFGSAFLSPPVILTVLIAGLLTLFALQRRSDET